MLHTDFSRRYSLQYDQSAKSGYAGNRNSAMKPIRILWLGRVSTDKQDLLRQRADQRKVAQRFNATLVRVIELEGVGGDETLTNDQVQLIMKELEDPTIDGLGLSSIDRLVRPAKDFTQYAIFQTFVCLGKKLWTARDGEIDPSTEDGHEKCISGASRAGSELREIRRRVHDAQAEKLLQRIMLSSSVPFGYRYIPQKEKGDDSQHMEIDPEKAEIVRGIFRWRVAGLSAYAICQRLEKAGILSPGNPRNKRAPGLWSPTVVKQLLRNRVYIGEYKWGEASWPCPAIIDEDTFYQCRRVLELARSAHVGRPSRQYLLRGFLWCAKCGKRCTTVPNGGRPLYQCGNIEAKPYRRICFAPRISVKRLEAAAWGALWTLITNPTLLLQHGADYYAALGNPGNDADDIRRERDRVAGQLERTQQMYRHGRMEWAKAARLIDEDEQQLKELDGKLRALGKIEVLPPIHLAEAAVREICDPLDEPQEYTDRRPVLENIQELAMRYLDGELDISGRIAVPVAQPVSRPGQKYPYRGGIHATDFYAAIPFKIQVRVS